MRFEEIYYAEMTDQSFLEMINLCKWFNEIYDYNPMIIGGWAVFFHHPTLGSRDIDILFPERKLKHLVVNQYLVSNNYKSEGLFEKEYYKEVYTSKGRERIIIDACSVEDINRLKGTDIIIPWKLAFKHQKSITFEGAELYIPKVEVLLLYKTKAAVDRTSDLKNTFDPFYLQHKILKDYLDIVNLIANCEIDFDLLKSLLDECHFYDYFILVCERIENSNEVLEKYRKWRGIKNVFISKLERQ